MKKFFLSTMMIFVGCFSAFTQQTATLGMKYQAVVRDASGQILADRDISIRIRLLAGDENGKEAYSEIHHATTNALGLIALNIGEGKTHAGNFSKVPWSQYNIWMEVAVDDNGGDAFAVISSTRLLAVPYAFHAGTADQLTGADRDNGTEKAAAYWKTNGNDTTIPGFHFLGTVDNNDLVVKTANQERMRVYATGNVNINNDLNIGNDLNVVNNATIGGDLIINGALSVFDLTVSHNATVNNDLAVGNDATVSNDLHVLGNADVDGNSNVDMDLAVGNNATVTNDLDVGGVANISGSATVGNNLDVTSNAIIGNDLTVNGDAHVSGTGTFDTDLTAGNDITANNNLYVGGDADITGATGVGTDLTVGNDAAITNDLNVGGDADITGAAGVGTNLTVGNDAAVSHDLTVTGHTTVGNGLGVSNGATISGDATINNNLVVNTNISTTTGDITAGDDLIATDDVTVGDDLTVTGDADITGHASAGNGLSVNNGAVIFGDATINNSLTVNTNISTNTGDITAGDDIISTDDVLVGDDLFANGNGTFNNLLYVGAGNPPYANVGLTVRTDYTYNLRSELADGSFLYYLRNDGQAFYSHKNGGSQSTTGSYTMLLENPDQGMFIRINKADLTAANNFIIFTQLNSMGGTVVAGRIESNGSGGVTYGSGGADYAEYLEREATESPLEYGDIVGVSNTGIVSRNTRDANKMMVVTNRPVVLGNMPEGADESKYEKVGFMGQLPVKVYGKVNAGDYILPNGKDDGTGIARSPKAMQLDDYNHIVGVAWESSEEEGLKYIHTAIGLNQNDLAEVATRQQKEIDRLQTDQAALQNQYNELLQKVNQLLEKQTNQ